MERLGGYVGNSYDNMIATVWLRAHTWVSSEWKIFVASLLFERIDLKDCYQPKVILKSIPIHVWPQKGILMTQVVKTFSCAQQVFAFFFF